MRDVGPGLQRASVIPQCLAGFGAPQQGQIGGRIGADSCLELGNAGGELAALAEQDSGYRMRMRMARILRQGAGGKVAGVGQLPPQQVDESQEREALGAERTGGPRHRGA